LVDIRYSTAAVVAGREIAEDYNSSGNLSQTRVNLLGARGIEGIITVPRSGAPTLNWLMYDGHGNLVRWMPPDYTLSGFQWRGGYDRSNTPQKIFLFIVKI
jgi:hypothetical protein